MANTNLAQYEQILKSLDQSLTEICNKHEIAHDYLTKLHDHSGQTLRTLDAAWTGVVNLFVQVEQLKSMRSVFKQAR